MQATYDYDAVADRMEAVLGLRPALSTLRAAAASDRRQSERGRGMPRLTAGLPRPLPSEAPNVPARFSAEQIELWLAHHPQTRWRQTCEALAQEVAAGGDREEAVQAARQAGLSWSAIADVLHEVDPEGGNRSWIFARYRHLG